MLQQINQHQGLDSFQAHSEDINAVRKVVKIMYTPLAIMLGASFIFT